MKYPTEEQCYKMLEEYGTPDHVIGHCKAVGRTAAMVCHALNQHGYNLDEGFVLAAGLLHDMARVEEDHGLVACEYLTSIGMPELGLAIRDHMTRTTYNGIENISTEDLVCLGDRVCKFDQYVGMEDRMEYVLNKFNRTPEAIERITKAKALLKKLMDDIEDVIGVSIDQLARENGLYEKQGDAKTPDWLLAYSN